MSSPNEEPTNEEITFEEAYASLEETVRALEEGGLSLAEATRLFEEGTRLARICNELLSSAELRITQAADGLRRADAPPIRGQGAGR